MIFRSINITSMGCGSSSSLEHTIDSPQIPVRTFQASGEPLVDAYQRLDVSISGLETTCPGPRLATAEAWIEFLQRQFNMEVINSHSFSIDPIAEGDNDDNVSENYENGLVRINPNETRKIVENQVQDIAKLALQLGILIDVKKAQSQEDFFANISRTGIEVLSNQFHAEVIDSAKSRAEYLLMKYNQLSSLYAEQDALIASFNGGTYVTLLEESLDSQLEVLRDIRDKLGSAMEQWRTCALLLKASVRSAQNGVETWKKIKENPKQNERELANFALECRQAIQASLISFECAQLSLPNVDLKFVTKRQLLAVNHANIYLLTDIVDNIRYSHTLKVFTAYSDNLLKSLNWLAATYSDTLKKDFNEAEENVQMASKRLREHRVGLFLNRNERQNETTTNINKSKFDNG